MTDHLTPLRLLLVTRWMSEPPPITSSRVLGGENRILKEQMEGRRIRLTDDHRRRLAAKGQRLGRRVLRRVATIVTPDTILRWHPGSGRSSGEAGPSGDHEGDLVAHSADGHGESSVGLQSHPGRVEGPRSPRREKHGRQGTERQRADACAGPAVVVARISAGALGEFAGW